MPTMTGGKLLADTVHGYGVTHVFFMPYIAPRALMEMEKLGIQRVQTHGEKSAAYMADAYARVKRAPAPVHGAVGRSGQSGRRLARRLAVMLAGGRHHRPRASASPIAPRLPRGGSSRALFGRDQVQRLRLQARPSSRIICARPSAQPLPARPARPISTCRALTAARSSMSQTI